MPKDKIKPPAETKAQLMQECIKLLFARYDGGSTAHTNYEFLLNFFTAADLVGIRDELKK